ncbi:hypothetical protein CCE11_22875 [Escherichia coli]|nr:hypothetical protein CCE11_22875 [Escherichia coli]
MPALCGHEQPDCQEGRFPPGTGMNVRLRLSFFSPAFSGYGLSEITSPSLLLFSVSSCSDSDYCCPDSCLSLFFFCLCLFRAFPWRGGLS